MARGRDAVWARQIIEVLNEQFAGTDIKFWLYERSEEERRIIHLDSVVVKATSRKHGLGTQFMEALTWLADKQNAIITLLPGLPGSHGTTSQARLIRFYGRFGFVRNTGRRADYALPAGMYRIPKHP